MAGRQPHHGGQHHGDEYLVGGCRWRWARPAPRWRAGALARLMARAGRRPGLAPWATGPRRSGAVLGLLRAWPARSSPPDAGRGHGRSSAIASTWNLLARFARPRDVSPRRPARPGDGADRLGPPRWASTRGAEPDGTAPCASGRGGSASRATRERLPGERRLATRSRRSSSRRFLRPDPLAIARQAGGGCLPGRPAGRARVRRHP